MVDHLYLGGTQDLKSQLQQLVVSHGVHPNRGDECSEQLLSALGHKQIQQVLGSPKPWMDLKAKANLHQPPSRVVLADELQDVIKRRAQEQKPVGRKQNKMKSSKQPRPAMQLTADQLTIPTAVFRQEDGTELPQILANQIGPTAAGVYSSG